MYMCIYEPYMLSANKFQLFVQITSYMYEFVSMRDVGNMSIFSKLIPVATDMKGVKETKPNKTNLHSTSSIQPAVMLRDRADETQFNKREILIAAAKKSRV